MVGLWYGPEIIFGTVIIVLDAFSLVCLWGFVSLSCRPVFMVIRLS